MTFIEFIGALLIFGPPLISILSSKHMTTDRAGDIQFNFMISIVIGVGVGWLTSLLVPLHFPAFTGLAAYWYAYYKMDDYFRDAISGGKIERGTTAPSKQNTLKTTPNNKVISIEKETKEANTDRFGLWCIVLFLLAVAVLYVTGRMVGTI